MVSGRHGNGKEKLTMSGFEEKEYKVFDLFEKQWALVTAGNMERFNSCTVAWGSLGTIFSRPGHSGPTATVYLHPSRYTKEIMMGSEFFTVSFLPEQYRKAYGVMGSRSGRDHGKAAEAGLTPVAMGETVTYEEAELVFLCRKIYQHQFTKSDLAKEVCDYYIAHPEVYPPDENGVWQPHWVFMGDILEVRDSRQG